MKTFSPDAASQALRDALAPLTKTQGEQLLEMLVEIKDRRQHMGDLARRPAVYHSIVTQAGYEHPEGAAALAQVLSRVHRD